MNQIFSTGDLFKPGAMVEIKTVFNETITGEVFAFDFESRLLILKLKSTNSSSKLCNITIVNIDKCSDVKIPPNIEQKKDSECRETIKLPDIDFKKLELRIQNAVDERKFLAKSFRSGAGTDGVLLYHQLVKTFNESDVRWQGNNILVKNNVLISAPFKSSSVSVINPKEKCSEQSVDYVKQIINKFWELNISIESSNQSSLSLKPVVQPLIQQQPAAAATTATVPASQPAPVPLTAAAVVKMNTSPQNNQKNGPKDSIGPVPKPLRA